MSGSDFIQKMTRPGKESVKGQGPFFHSSVSRQVVLRKFQLVSKAALIQKQAQSAAKEEESIKKQLEEAQVPLQPCLPPLSRSDVMHQSCLPVPQDTTWYVLKAHPTPSRGRLRGG